MLIFLWGLLMVVAGWHLSNFWASIDDPDMRLSARWWEEERIWRAKYLEAEARAERAEAALLKEEKYG